MLSLNSVTKISECSNRGIKPGSYHSDSKTQVIDQMVKFAQINALLIYQFSEFTVILFNFWKIQSPTSSVHLRRQIYRIYIQI